MKHTFSILFVLLFMMTLFSCEEKKVNREKATAEMLLQQIDSFTTTKNELLKALENNQTEALLQQLFLRSRLAYKKIEWATEYYSPQVSKFVNGAPVIDAEKYSGQVFEPAGLQVMEGFLFPHYDTTTRAELIAELQQLDKQTEKYKIYFSKIALLDWQIYDAAKLELFRIQTMGITGFDNPLTLHSMEESAAALQSLQQAFHAYLDEEDSEHLTDKFKQAIAYLHQHKDFNTFDRARFIIQYANPITTALVRLEKKQHIQMVRYNRLLDQDAKTLFDTNAFNVNAYTTDPASFVTKDRIALGKLLFVNPVLSGNNSRSCISCHQPEKGFADGLVANTVFNSTERLYRNTPTLINAALQPAQFHDLRSVLLEEQIDSVINNKNEMHGSLKIAAQKLWEQESYKILFSKAYPNANRKAIDTLEILNALGSYVRSLTSLDSRFDRYMRGNASALTAQEVEGFNLFMGKAKCGTCHYMPLFNGAVPPLFMKMETEVLGVPQTKNSKTIDPDLGRYATQKIPDFKHSFKTPTVRNASLTAPYMHNGVFASLEEVIDFYDEGGGAGRGINVPTQTLASGPLKLSPQEKAALIAFVKSLESRPK